MDASQVVGQPGHSRAIDARGGAHLTNASVQLFHAYDKKLTLTLIFIKEYSLRQNIQPDKQRSQWRIPQSSQRAHWPPLIDARTDARQRVIVDAGIAVQGSSNTMSAVEYLRTRDIRSHVIERVLLEPHRRRSGS